MHREVSGVRCEVWGEQGDAEVLHLTPHASLLTRKLGLVDYVPTWQAMQAFTAARDETTQDELWLLEHPPVYTQGQAGKPEHVLNPGDIPIVQIDRGGQVT